MYPMLVHLWMQHTALILNAGHLEDFHVDVFGPLSSEKLKDDLITDPVVRVIRWNAIPHHDHFHIDRPSSYEKLKDAINKKTPLASTDVLYYFPRGQINSEASNRRTFDETTFADWLASERFPYLLPDV
jgi:hypothetical protein